MLPQRYRDFGPQRVACTTMRLGSPFARARADPIEREALKGGLMEESCFICGVCEAGKDESGVLLCGCKGYIRYVVWGVCPTPKRRGPKPKITIHDVLRKIIELPASAGLQRVVNELPEGTDRRAVLRVIKPYVDMLRELDPNCVGFKGLQAVVKGRGKSRIPDSRQKNLLPD
jgi:hypothetical protein